MDARGRPKSIEKTILNRIRGNGGGWAFSPQDFVDLGSRAAVGLALYRLEHAGTIRRVLRGVYDYPRHSRLLGEHLSPDFDLVARALARKFGWRIQAGGPAAQNLLGLSTQVPARVMYLSDGPDRSFRVGQVTLQFKKAPLKEAHFKLKESALITQALKSMGPRRITPEVIAKIRRWLPPGLRAKVLTDTRTATGWVYTAIQQIAQPESHG